MSAGTVTIAVISTPLALIFWGAFFQALNVWEKGGRREADCPGLQLPLLAIALSALAVFSIAKLCGAS